MQISKVVRSFGALSLLNFARKHTDKLGQSAEPEISSGADRLVLATGALELAYAARRPLAAMWSQAVEDKDAADDALDEFISNISYDLLSPKNLKGDRSASAYRALFPDGNINFINGPDRAELAQVAGMVTYLKANVSHPMADQATELETRAATLTATLEPSAAAEAVLRSAQAVERDKLEALRRALRKSAALLRAEFMDEKKVEALFPTVAESKVKEDDPTPA